MAQESEEKKTQQLVLQRTGSGRGKPKIKRHGFLTPENAIDSDVQEDEQKLKKEKNDKNLLSSDIGKPQK